MKKLIVVLLLVPILGFAQEITYIKTLGRAVHNDEATIFKGSVVLSTTFSSYPSQEISLDQLKTKYDVALKKNGLRLADFTEEPMLYLRMGYDKEGTLYRFETAYIEKFQGFLASNSFGAQRMNYDTSFTINEEEAAKLVDKAIENARTKANLIAGQMGKNLGDIMWVEDNNLIHTEIRKGLYHDQNIGEHFYQITVQFSLKE